MGTLGDKLKTIQERVRAEGIAKVRFESRMKDSKFEAKANSYRNIFNQLFSSLVADIEEGIPPRTQTIKGSAFYDMFVDTNKGTSMVSKNYKDIRCEANEFYPIYSDFVDKLKRECLYSMVKFSYAHDGVGMEGWMTFSVIEKG